jgi:hypothetical protein
MKLGFRILPLILGLALAACGDDKKTTTGTDDDDDDNGSLDCSRFGSANINSSGAVAGTIRTCVQYAVAEDDSTGTTSFVIVGASAASEDAAYTLIVAREGARPTTGTFQVGEGTGKFTGFFSKNTEPTRLFFFTSGTVTISTSTTGTVSGSLNVVATEFMDDATVTISGTFTSKCVTAPAMEWSC